MTRPIHIDDQQVYTKARREVLFYDSCNVNRDNKETSRRQLTVHAVGLYTLLNDIWASTRKCI